MYAFEHKSGIIGDARKQGSQIVACLFRSIIVNNTYDSLFCRSTPAFQLCVILKQYTFGLKLSVRCPQVNFSHTSLAPPVY